MNFDFYIDFWKRAFDFKGRSSREEYWYTYLVNFLICLVFTFLAFIPFVSILSSIFGLAILIPSLAISIRRLHDSNHTCLPIIIIFIIEAINMFIMTFSFVVLIIMVFAGEDVTLLGLFGLLMPSIFILVCAIIQIIYMCLPSFFGVNKYGQMRAKLNLNKKKEQSTSYEYQRMQQEEINSNQDNPYFQSYESTYGNVSENNNVQNNKQNLS